MITPDKRPTERDYTYALLTTKKCPKGKTAYFGAIDKCRFKGKVVPGDKLRLETRIIKRKGPVGIGEAIASVDGKVVVKAELTFMLSQE